LAAGDGGVTTGLRFAEQAVAASVADAPGSLKGLRAAGAEAFKTLGFPTTRNEDWHYTNVSAIATAQYTPAGETAPRTFAQYLGVDETVQAKSIISRMSYPVRRGV